MSLRASFAVALVGIVLLVSGCSGGSEGSGVAQVGSTSGTSQSSSQGGSNYQSAIVYARCLRSHGVPDWPDPNSEGLFNKDQVDQIPDSSQLEQAEGACASLQPAGQYFQVDPAHLREIIVEGLRFAHCMRTHGITKFPDPDQAHLQNGQLGFEGAGIDPYAPQFQAVQEACQHFLTGGGG